MTNATPPTAPPTMAPVCEVLLELEGLEDAGEGPVEVGEAGLLDEDVVDGFAGGVYANAFARAGSLNVGSW